MSISVFRHKPDGSVETRTNINSIDLQPYINDGWVTEMLFPQTKIPEPTSPIPTAPSQPDPLTYENKPPDYSDAVTQFINNASDVAEIRAIPTIGDAAAKIIFEERPENGYGSLDELPSKIFGGRFKTDIDVVRLWNPKTVLG